MTMRGLLLPLVALLVVPAAAIPGDEIVLQDGRTLEGELLTPDDAPSIEIRVHEGGMVAIERFQRDEVVSIHHGRTPHEVALAAFAEAKRRLGEGGSAEEWLALAHQAQALHDRAAVRACAQEAELRDRWATEAHRLLEEVVTNGIWMLPREAAIAQGLVFYEGQWMTWGERQRRIAAAREAAAADAAAAVERQHLVARTSGAPPTEDLGISTASSSLDPNAATDYYGPLNYQPILIGQGWNQRCGGGVVGWGGISISGGNGHWAVNFHW